MRVGALVLISLSKDCFTWLKFSIILWGFCLVTELKSSEQIAATSFCANRFHDCSSGNLVLLNRINSKGPVAPPDQRLAYSPASRCDGVCLWPWGINTAYSRVYTINKLVLYSLWELVMMIPVCTGVQVKWHQSMEIAAQLHSHPLEPSAIQAMHSASFWLLFAAGYHKICKHIQHVTWRNQLLKSWTQEQWEFAEHQSCQDLTTVASFSFPCR